MSELLTGLTLEDVMDAAENNPELGRAGGTIVGSDGEKYQIHFTVEKDYGKLSAGNYAPSFTVMKWGTYTRYDLRRWLDAELTKPGKGTTFTDDELELLRDALAADCFDEHYGALRVYQSGKAKAVFYKNLGTLQEREDKNGKIWRKEVNLLDWGTGSRIDIRKWNEDYTKCSKGITLKKEEVDRLLEILEEL